MLVCTFSLGDVEMVTGNRWIEVYLDAITQNYITIKKQLKEKVLFCAVVKADAYGLGAVRIAMLLQELGVDMLAVTTVAEGLELRKADIQTPILVMAPFLEAEAKIFLTDNLTPVVSHKEQLSWLAQNCEKTDKLSIHLKLETGMHRSGIAEDEIAEFLLELAKYSQLKVSGLMTHFSKAHKNSKSMAGQLKRYDELCQHFNLLDEDIIKHVGNSAVALEVPAAQYNMVRIGTLLYGQYPPNTTVKLNLQNPWQGKARVIQRKTCPNGETIGYGNDFKAKQEIELAVVPIGWADGLGLRPQRAVTSFREALKQSLKIWVSFFKRESVQIEINGKSYTQVGRLSMQMSIFQVDQEVLVGQIANIPLGRLTANSRLPRIYIENQEIISRREVIY